MFYFCLFIFLISDIQEKAESALRAHSSSTRRSKTQVEIPEDVPKTGKVQVFIKEEALVGICNVCIVLFLYHLDVVRYLVISMQLIYLLHRMFSHAQPSSSLISC